MATVAVYVLEKGLSCILVIGRQKVINYHLALEVVREGQSPGCSQCCITLPKVVYALLST